MSFMVHWIPWLYDTTEIFENWHWAKYMNLLWTLINWLIDWLIDWLIVVKCHMNSYYHDDGLAVSFIGGGNWSMPKETICLTKCCIEYILPWTRFELPTVEVICTGSCKSNYHTITTTTTLCHGEIIFTSIYSKCRWWPSVGSMNRCFIATGKRGHG